MWERLVQQGYTAERIEAEFPIFGENKKPEIYADLVWIWEGFTMLSSARQWGMSGPQPVSLGEMLSYLSFAGIDDSEEKIEFVHLCLFLDRIFMADSLAKTKPGQNQKKPPSRPPGLPPR